MSETDNTSAFLGGEHSKQDCPMNDQPSYNIKITHRARNSGKWDQPDNSSDTMQLRECRTCGKRWGV